ncbi:MAG: PH domain-containing protein [Bacteroidota bacterium]
MTQFKTKIDKWYVAIHWICLGLMAIAIGALWLDPETAISLKALFSLLMGGVAWLIIDIYVNTRYTVSADTLFIQSGRFKWRIKLSNIEWVKPSRSILSSPALSLDRLAVKQLNSSIPVLISPDRAGASHLPGPGL